jgi:DNA-directed RNA polymerase subunit RPC12/RpoP
MSQTTCERKKWPPEQDGRGLVCRHCGCRHFRVIYTRPAYGGHIMRRRECRHCGRRITTWEKPIG